MDVFESKASAPETQESTGTNLTPAAGTRHHTLLNSNETPLDSELLLIRSISCRIDARILTMDEEIARLVYQVKRPPDESQESEWPRARLDGEEKWTGHSLGLLLANNGQFDTEYSLKQLRNERQSLVRLRSQNNAVLSPLRRIPPEVLGEIFTLTLPDIWTHFERQRFSPKDSPWSLTHVSHGWRATAISNSSLWSLVVIDYPQKLNPAGSYPLPMLETHIGRARKLKVHFYGEEECDPAPQSELFSCLASHSSQWEELSLGLTSALVPLLDSLQDRIPSLCRLNIQWSDGTSQGNVDSIGCFHRAPCLVDFTVLNEFRSVPVRLAIEQLTCYRADNSWGFHQGVLGLGMNLVEVRIIIAFDDEPWPEVTQVLHLPSLRRLYVSHSEMLGFLTAPALKEIALQVEATERREIESSFRPFVERSGCALDRLCLRGCVGAATLAYLLKSATTITELVITKSLEPDEEADDFAFLAVLTITPETPDIAPQLQSISLGCEPGITLPRALCLAMIHSRWKQPHRALRAANFLSADPLEPVDDLNMREDGLDLMIQSGQLAQEIIDGWTYNPTWN